MLINQIIDGLQFTIDMFLLDPVTGQILKEPRNEMDLTTIDSCRCAIEILKSLSCTDYISRNTVLKAIGDVHPLDYNAQSFKTMVENIPCIQADLHLLKVGAKS